MKTKKLTPYEVSLKLEKEGIKVYSKKPKGWKLIHSGNKSDIGDQLSMWYFVRKNMESNIPVRVVEPHGMRKYHVYVKKVI